jgi:hypothetical protein
MIRAALMLCLLLPGQMSHRGSAAAPVFRDTAADTWTATDALGRTLPDREEADKPRRGRFVGIFYFLWMGQHGTDGPYDISRILAEDPGAMLKPDSPLWGPQNHYHHWGEPLFGYYLSDDAWVLGKHAQMLSDANIDVVIFDVTNQVTYQKVYMRLCEVFTELRRLGRHTPQIAFLCPFWDPSKVVGELYAHLYGPQRYAELWFRWRGKPLILADPAKAPPETRSFFTFRKPQPSYFEGPTGPDQWGWLEIHPQHTFLDRESHTEQVTVGVAQNASGKRLCAFSEKDTYGRSWHDGKKDGRPDGVLHGFNFAEQWEHALKLDPEFIFITGWNEWIAMRLPEFNGVREPVMFVDQFTQEYSRDTEPMRGGHGDNYYYQMVDYIRRFKGVRTAPQSEGPSAIRVDGDFRDWSEVLPEYLDDAGDTLSRNHPGYDGVGRYTNTTGRNDFVLLKAAYDREMIYFYARTSKPITRPGGSNWMHLYLDADADPKTGWEGYDFIVNRKLRGNRMTLLESTSEGWNWRPGPRLKYHVRGHELELGIPRRDLGLDAGPEPPRFNFKWADNMQREGDVMEFTVNGDAAPNGRFRYAFR